MSDPNFRRIIASQLLSQMIVPTDYGSGWKVIEVIEGEDTTRIRFSTSYQYLKNGRQEFEVKELDIIIVPTEAPVNRT